MLKFLGLLMMGDQNIQAGRDVNVNAPIIQGKTIESIYSSVSHQKGTEAASQVKAILESLQVAVKSFPKEQRENAKSDLSLLANELDSKTGQHNHGEVRRLLKKILAVCGAALVAVAPVSGQFKEVMSNFQFASADAVEIVENFHIIREEVQTIQGDPVKFEELSKSGNQEVVETIEVAARQVSDLWGIFKPSKN